MVKLLIFTITFPKYTILKQYTLKVPYSQYVLSLDLANDICWIFIHVPLYSVRRVILQAELNWNNDGLMLK